MNKKVLWIVNSVLALVSGIALVLVPGLATSLLGLQIGPVGLGLSRVLGAALITLGILLWMLRKAEDPLVVRALLTALFVGNLVAALMTLLGQLFLLVDSALIAPIQSIIGPVLMGAVQTLVIFLISLAFTVIYGVLLFGRKGPAAAKQPKLSKKPV
jgi:hypothetical protein